MDYQSIPSLGLKLPMLGFGAMRLPTDAEGAIIVEPSLALLQRALEAGVNYFDTAYVYHNTLNEKFLGEHFFSKLPRESFLVATKLPCFKAETVEDCQGFFDEQLANLRLEMIDFYLAHNLNKQTWAKFKALGGPAFLTKLKESGRVKHVGFSYHGEPEDLGAIIDDYPWEFVQLQINYYDWPEQVQNAKLQYEEVTKRQLPLIVMEPIRGHALADLPAEAEQALKAVHPTDSAARWAFRWVGSLPGVSIILSGMNTPEQLEDNLATFSDFQPLDERERAAVDKALEVLMSVPSVPCTSCDYCAEPCPQNIQISRSFEMYNDYLRFGNDKFLGQYLSFVKEENRAANCINCGVCSEHCPQHIAIPERLAEFQAELDRFGAAQK